jgi:hypothetical protein
MGIHLKLILYQERAFVITYGSSVLAQIAGAKYSPRELFELFGLDRLEEAQADLGTGCNFLKRGAHVLPKAVKIKGADEF